METSQVIIKADAGDTYYFRLGCFPVMTLGDHQESDSKQVIRRSFYKDIARKYGLPCERLGNFLHIYRIEILRSLAVFGDHEYIVDKIRCALQGKPWFMR